MPLAPLRSRLVLVVALAGAAALAVPACLTTGAADPEAAASAAASCPCEAPCPGDAAAWRGWAEDRVADLLTTTVRARGELFEVAAVAARAATLHATFARIEERHPGRLDPATPIGARLANLRRFAAAVRWTSDPAHEGGLSIPDADYLARVRRAATFPPLLRSQPFLRAVSDPARYAEAVALIDAHNATLPEAARFTVLLYRSAFIRTPDRTTHGRFFVHVPGDPEQWIQFGILTPGMDEALTMHSVSVVALVGPPEAAGSREAVLVDWWRVYEDDGTIRLGTRLDDGNGTNRCFDCHKIPVLPIHPDEEYDLDDAGRLVPKLEGRGEVPARLNALIAETGSPDAGGLFDPAGFGPALGPVGRARPDALLRRWCGATVDDASLARIREAMDCSSCHDGELVGRHNFPQAVASDQDLGLFHPVSEERMPIAKVYVERGLMPPDSDLTPAERRALWACLQAEYFDPTDGSGVLRDWLLGDSTAD